MSPLRIAEPLLVSLHMPKTAGTSFADALRRIHGNGLVTEYQDMTMQIPRGRREARMLASAAWRLPMAWNPAVTAIHGHVLPVAYRLAPLRRPTTYITWLRDPVQRAVSHYHFWRRDYDGSDPRQPLRNRMLREAWSLERFCLGPELRNVYQRYLWAFDPNAFAFIGITERYADDFERLPGHGWSASDDPRLANPERGERYVIEPALEARIRAHHAADVRLYEWASSGRTRRFRW